MEQVVVWKDSGLGGGIDTHCQTGIHREDVIEELYEHWKEDENRFIQEARRFSEQLSETLQTERNYSIHDGDDAWDADSIREEAISRIKSKDS